MSTAASISRSEYEFTAEGFADSHTQGMVKYERILMVKRQKDTAYYEIQYLNEKNKKLKTEISANVSEVPTIDRFITENTPGIDIFERSRTFIEAGAAWFWIFGVVALVGGISLYLMISGESARVPVILLPFVYLGMFLGVKNVITIIIGVSVVSLCGSIFSYSNKKTIMVFNNKMHGKN